MTNAKVSPRIEGFCDVCSKDKEHFRDDIRAYHIETLAGTSGDIRICEPCASGILAVLIDRAITTNPHVFLMSAAGHIGEVLMRQFLDTSKKEEYNDDVGA